MNLERPDHTGYKQEIIEAIQSSDVATLESMLRELNIDLTGIESASFTPDENLRGKLDKFFSEAQENGLASVILYLGDSGLSRIRLQIDGDAISIELTDNSTDEAKKKWDLIQ